MSGSGAPPVDEPQQGSLDLLLGAEPRRVKGGRPVDGVQIAENRPVARVAVSLGLPHLDRLFDYLVPAALERTAAPGVRVKVRFAGRDVDGFVIERTSEAEHAGHLEPLRRVVSPEAVLTPQIARLARSLADDHVGTLDDVLRLAVPPRHATAERELAPAEGDPQASASDAPSQNVAVSTAPPMTSVPSGEEGPWGRYVAGPSFLRHLAGGRSPAAAWVASPAEDDALDWPQALAHAAAATLASGRGVVVVLPDHRDVERVDAALEHVLGTDRHVRLTADQGPAARYTSWLKVLRGHVRCVVGTRAAAFAPVHDLGLVAWWSDGDDLLAEPRAPYPHVRDVLRLRRDQEGAALLVGGFTRTAHVQSWIEQGWIHAIGEQPAQRRARCAPVTVAGEGGQEERYGPGAHARLPSAAWQAAKKALQTGPVLVQVPRRGYLPGLACRPCGLPARCAACHGPLALPAQGAAPACRWCGTPAPRYECPHCGSALLRASVVGAERTVEELGRAFPGVPVRFSGAGDVLSTVPAAPALVVATPGAEPVAASGYAATLVLDAWASLDRPRLDAGEQALARWMQAAALTRPRRAGGQVVLAGVPDSPALGPVEAFVRLAPEWFAARELDERRGLDLPPLVWLAKVTGQLAAVGEALEQAALPDVAASVKVLGPWPLQPAGAPSPAEVRAGGADHLPGAVDGGGPPGPGSGTAGTAGTAAERPAVALVTCAPDDAPAVCAALGAVRASRAARREALVSVRVGAADVE